MRLFALLGFFAFAFNLPTLALAHDQSSGDDHSPCHGEECEQPTRPVCFNIVCNYESHDNRGDKTSCKAASTFFAPVTLDGGEVESQSHLGNNPQLEVTCDDNKVTYNNSARRYTDLLETRIQGEEGPTPAILLPRGELHSGPDHKSGNHVSPSILELQGEHGLERLEGSCQIWTGAPVIAE